MQVESLFEGVFGAADISPGVVRAVLGCRHCGSVYYRFQLAVAVNGTQSSLPAITGFPLEIFFRILLLCCRIIACMFGVQL